jgi:hypothetical protein
MKEIEDFNKHDILKKNFWEEYTEIITKIFE